ncbi:MAG: NAD(P)/FAD-dependent oxidoreductase [Candidatus Hodarchaeales archaeon]|jgi:geranylgeranyl reductase family protein
MGNSCEHFDIAIIGAGPGGASAATHAAQNGFSTCLFEKEELGLTGRYKACGGALDWNLIQKLDYPEEKIERVVDSLELHHVDGETYSKSGEGAVVWRSLLDKYLTDIAVENGSRLKENEPLVAIEKEGMFYTVFTEKGKYQAKYVLAADGVSSPTLRKLKWPRFAREDLILTITQEMKTTKQHIEEILGSSSLHLFFSIRRLSHLGYAWLFPKKQVVTIGWGNQLIRVKHAREKVKPFLDLPLVKEVLKNSISELFKAHLIPVGLRSQIFNENVFAIGDAGGLVDPISGKGIPYALSSGRIAIDTIKTCENKKMPDNLGFHYKKTLEKAFLRVLKKKRAARDRIYQNEETLKNFLGLWEKYRSSEIVRRGLI